MGIKYTHLYPDIPTGTPELSNLKFLVFTEDAKTYNHFPHIPFSLSFVIRLGLRKGGWMSCIYWGWGCLDVRKGETFALFQAFWIGLFVGLPASSATPVG